MNTTKWLNRAYKLNQQIESKQEQIAMWQSLALKITSCPSPVPRGGGTEGGKIENYCAKIIDAQEELRRQVEALVDLKREISAAVNMVQDPTSRILLEQRYLLGKSWKDVGDKMGYTEEYVRRDLHEMAVKDVAKFIPR